MPSLIDIRRRIRSVKNTQQITKAMKMVATARLRRAQERVINSRPYAKMAAEMLRNVAAAAATQKGAERASEHPLLASRPEKMAATHPGRGPLSLPRTAEAQARDPCGAARPGG